MERTPTESFLLTGRKPNGQPLAVTILAVNEQDAERQYEFRYRGLGYLLPKEFTATPEGESIPILKVRSRQRHGLHQGNQETHPAETIIGVGSHEGSLDYIQGESGEDHHNVVYLGE